MTDFGVAAHSDGTAVNCGVQILTTGATAIVDPAEIIGAKFYYWTGTLTNVPAPFFFPDPNNT